MVLYLGNKLQRYGKNPTTIDTLGHSLKEIYPKILTVSEKKGIIFRLWDMWKTIWINRKRIELVLIDTYSTKAFHFAWTSARICNFFNIPYIPIIHGGSFKKRIEKSPFLVKKYIYEAKTVVTPSGFLRNVIKESLNFEPIVIPNSIRVGILSKDNSVSFKTIPRIFWLRAYQKLYNPVLAVEIIHILHKKKGIKAELIMVGPDKDGTLKKVKEKIKEYSLCPFISTYEKMSREDWVKLAKNCSVFLNTTTIDNTPVSVIENMALGLPIVSTNVGGLPYLIRDGLDGLLFPSGDANLAADLILQIHSAPEKWAKFSKEALLNSKEKDWNSSVKNQWSNLFAKYVELA
ncbi:glycosyltransferase family 1 protein [Algoriphagus kandeliae]|uniref:Glycosyltransferase family 1 protein n=1 Tax=Algoriphagus kandeliae TaxID=2562278 RepID=A0A4Y9QXN8_9BACT|nr:glycosyltransferase [Algoriphagus kandeliae]TFV97221.1 glycosyltransferase family 1 protein [Algoriphagus kandeliae]